ncbi:putative endoplasmic reticulum membrane protein C16E8.02 [Mycena venus]|uniref:Putative endoplasmic reticulum membrane protein C16E8.02 n=1 Tax=Mycena venus TaxID=2733690 RepID=A0A8H6Y712_9AGAR|nr:putative endoplasmic reticulum membrane protein C16E8.02 [Mycena venus]
MKSSQPDARLLRSFQVMASQLPVPSFIPAVHYRFSEYLEFDLNYSAIHAGLYLAYYFILEPFAALLYTPQLVLSLLTATAYSRNPDHITNAMALHAFSWVAQFLGHGVAERTGPSPHRQSSWRYAVVLAPFFVHLEILFALGYRPEMHKELNNNIGKEITRIRKAQGDKRRAAAAKEN